MFHIYLNKKKIGRARTLATIQDTVSRYLQKISDKQADTDLEVPFCSAVLCSAAAAVLLLDVTGLSMISPRETANLSVRQLCFIFV